MAIELGHRKVGDGYPCFITFEAGATHDGVGVAKKLVEVAARAKADAVKFQILEPERMMADKNQQFSYTILINKKTGETKEVSESLYQILKRRTLTLDEWREVKKVADKAGLLFFATVSTTRDVDFVKEIGAHSIKICSGDVDHHPLIRYAAKTGLCLQLDTGNSTIGEVEAAVDVARSVGNDRIIIHQCPSGYPARLESINLRIIPTLKQMFQVPIAYSDHTPGHDMDVAAVAMGANLVEKTITLDSETPSVEHIFSLEPDEAVAFVKTIREIEIAMGATRRMMSPEERKKRNMTRRSCYYKSDMKKGDALDESSLEFSRPGIGISPTQIDNLIGKKLVANKKSGEMVQWSDLSQG
ncbi:MAG: N-acetylneuraminate synthase family protein [Verrucomicrobiota bacterium]